MSAADMDHDSHKERLFLYALQALPQQEAVSFEQHVAGCPICRRELDSLSPVVESLVDWPTDVLRPTRPLWDRLAERISSESGGEPLRAGDSRWVEPSWEEVAPGISCKLLATDAERNRVSMLVRLAPGTDYPPHRHGGLEELHLLDGELWINERKLYPGDYSRAEAGTEDKRVWSATGCTCVLITSIRDELR
ncbi:MAG TPA: cupin domain-containing protein [Candidatus Binatia bacterium]|nr:cupin domain-containing protein [Candidatus Binatia bacterium]